MGTERAGTEYIYCGDLATPLVDGQTSWMYCITLIQSLYRSCYVSLNKLVLSYFLLRLLPHYVYIYKYIFNI
jgi:hypothetical protein